MQRPRVFGIGLNKTGTISLHEALTTLGWNSLHWGGPEVREVVEKARDDGRPLVEDLPDFDAFSDIWVLSENFTRLDSEYPGSLFVLTTRPEDDWVDSRRRHVARNRERAAAGTYAGNFLTVDEAAWRDEYRSHHKSVRAYFAGRDNFIEMRITEGDGYESLCPFLGVPIHDTPFPARHRGN